MYSSITRGVCGLFASILIAVTPAQALNTYHIGNSLTWDAKVSAGLPMLAADAGLSLTTGYHIRCNMPLSYIVDHPTEVCVTPNAFGDYTDALAHNTWDAITLQPHSASTPRQEYEAAKSLIQLARQNPNNRDTRFYLYASWHNRPVFGTSLYDQWYDPAPVDPDYDLIRNAKAFDWVFDQLVSDPELAGVDLAMIHAGDVLANLDRRITLGLIPGLTDAALLYRDRVHLSNLGQFAVANTVLSTLFGIDPTGTPGNSSFTTSGNYVAPVLITPAIATSVQEAVWDVLTTYPENGGHSGDLNYDGIVGLEDLSIILNNWDRQPEPVEPMPGDYNGDGIIWIQDLNVVLTNWNRNVNPGDQSVGDSNGDGVIDIGDLVHVLHNWNKYVPPVEHLLGDSDSDGLVGIQDLYTVLNNWDAGAQQGEAALVIPEPSVTSAFVGLCLVYMTRRSRPAL